MKLVLFGTPSDQSCFKENCGELCIDDLQSFDQTHTFVEYLSNNYPNAVVVLMNGAYGMEGAIAARRICPSVPLIWFTDDAGFGSQSYRLDVSYFGTKPLSEEKIETAFFRSKLINS